MTPKEAFEMLEKCGTNTEQPYEDMILEALYQSLTSYEELKRDVKRYFELYELARDKWGNGLDYVEAYEYTKLHIKLSKVGNEE